MSLPTNRATLKEWCLRKLGQPVIRVNVDSQQLDERISEALDYFHSYHYDGIERIYVQHEVTATSLVFIAPIVGSYQKNEIIEGSISKARARVIEQADDNLSIKIKGLRGKFEQGENIVGLASNVSNELDEIILGDMDNGFVTLPENIINVKRVLPMKTQGNYLFDIKYHYALNTIPSLMGFDLIGFDMLNKHLSLLDHLLNPKASINFNQVTGRVFINMDWNAMVSPGDILVFEVQAVVNPEDYPKIFSDEWVRNYSVALIRQQWAQNMGKYRGIQLPGNVTLDAETMKREAEEEIRRLREELERKFMAPPKMLIG
jgi:hypothetical protein